MQSGSFPSSGALTHTPPTPAVLDIRQVTKVWGFERRQTSQSPSDRSSLTNYYLFEGPLTFLSYCSYIIHSKSVSTTLCVSVYKPSVCVCTILPRTRRVQSTLTLLTSLTGYTPRRFIPRRDPTTDPEDRGVTRT